MDSCRCKKESRCGKYVTLKSTTLSRIIYKHARNVLKAAPLFAFCQKKRGKFAPENGRDFAAAAKEIDS
jgi:hypothetical protein